MIYPLCRRSACRTVKINRIHETIRRQTINKIRRIMLWMSFRQPFRRWPTLKIYRIGISDRISVSIPNHWPIRRLNQIKIFHSKDSLPDLYYSDEGDANGEETTQTSATKKPDKDIKQYFFSSLKSKRKAATNSTESKIERPDVFIDNALPSNENKTATIRKPHKPLKCPNNSDDSSTSKTEVSA